MNDRDKVLAAAALVAKGDSSFIAYETKVETGWCLALVHSICDKAFTAQWALMNAAYGIMNQRGRAVPWASDLAAAAKQTGLLYSELHPGCLVYWDWSDHAGHAYGHIGVYLGAWGPGRIPSILENTSAIRGTGVWDARHGAVRITPVAACPKPTLLIAPTRQALTTDRAAYAATHARS